MTFLSTLFGGTKKPPVLSSSSAQNVASLPPKESVLPAGVFGTKKGGRRTRGKKSMTKKANAKSRRRK